jgi:hypothetical protein
VTAQHNQQLLFFSMIASCKRKEESETKKNKICKTNIIKLIVLCDLVLLQVVMTLTQCRNKRKKKMI